MDDIVMKFERVWNASNPPKISAVLATNPALTFDIKKRLRLLVELISIDLEFRWRGSSRQTGSEDKEYVARWVLEDYLAEFDEISTSNVLLELIGEEYRARMQWGDRPEHIEFLRRFSSYGKRLIDRLKSIDREMRDEVDEELSLVKRRDSTSKSPLPTPRGTDLEASLFYGDFTLQQLIGAGGVGKVYRALQKNVEKQVAVKFLRKNFVNDARAVSRFVMEALIIGNLQHPGLVEYHGLGRTPNGGFFIAMDFIDGSDLGKLLSVQIPQPQTAISWIDQAATTLDYVHQQGVIHCDLKPGNLLLDHDRRIRVTDFGFARSVGTLSHTLKRIEGTAAFMAPEQVDSYWGEISPRTDVYGLGAVLYALLTGKPPFVGRRIADVLTKVVSTEPPNLLDDYSGGVTQSIRAICLRCLQKQPRLRYESGEALAAALRKCVTE